MRWVDCIGSEGQRGKLMTYMANVAVYLWGCDLLKQWNTEINIPLTSAKDHKPDHVSGKKA